MASTARILSLASINQRVVGAQYAVRGELVIRAEDYKKQLASGAKLPFEEIVHCNIGNPQELGQNPITFFRQVLSLVEYPELLSNSAAAGIFPADAIERARLILKNVSGGTGAYSNSQGLPFARAQVAEFIEKRDGFPASADDIFLTDGASPGVQACLRVLLRNENDGVMIPIPQYPLYSASIPLFGGSQLNYYLDEASNWGLEIKELERSFAEAKARGIAPRALVIINPGNPTGQVLEEHNMREIIKFCHKNRVLLLADEVYQENVYQKEAKPFFSFKKVLRSMGAEYSDFELISFHSVSKGFLGECGKRGGYYELTGIDPEVKAQMYKLASISLCPNVVGQLMISLMVNPPKPGQPSYDLYIKERDAIYNSLKRRAVNLIAALNKLEGVTCNPAEGAMYAFPQITIPPRAVEEARKLNKAPDAFYAGKLLDATGICIVPGSGFGQRDGTFHFRTTFLPAEDKIERVIEKISKFHADFMAQYK